MTDIQAWLTEALTLADQATEGPWHPSPLGDTIHAGELDHRLDLDGLPISFLPDPVVGEAPERCDAAFIADARTRLPQALDALQAVHDMHNDSGDGWCNECSDGFLANHPCPTVLAIQDAIGGPQ